MSEAPLQWVPWARRRTAPSSFVTALRIAGAALLGVALLGAAREARACDNDPPEVLARSAEAIALIEVRFAGRRSRVRVLHWYKRPRRVDALPPKSKWLGFCLYDARRLRHEHAYRQRVGLEVPRAWRHALRRGRYRAIVVLSRGRDGKHFVTCAKSERFAPWEGSPGHRAWRQRLLATLCTDGTVTSQGRDEACRAASVLGNRAGRVPPEERARVIQHEQQSASED